MVWNKNLVFTFLFVLFISFAADAQDEILHTVKSGESLSRLAKQYHTTVGEIMRANGMNSKSILKIGKTIKIPSATPAAIVETPAKTEVKTAPVKKEIIPAKKIVAKDADAKIHIVGKKETLYGIGKKYNVTVAQLKSWNDLKTDNIHENQKLIIIPNNGIKPMVESDVAVVEKKSANPLQQVAATTETKSVTANKSVDKKPIATTSAPETVVTKLPEKQADKPFTQQAPAEQKANVAVAATTIAAPIVNELPEKKIEKPVQEVAKEEPKPVVNQVQTKPVLPIVTSQDSDEDEVNINLNNISGEGYFAALYHKGKNELTGDAAIFKTESGAAEKKYYILINNIDAGAIVRITARGKTVYAKVLGPLPDIKEDNGLLLRISNAAAVILGITESRFAVKVNY